LLRRALEKSHFFAVRLIADKKSDKATGFDLNQTGSGRGWVR
jgi:hypothetical protein